MRLSLVLPLVLLFSTSLPALALSQEKPHKPLWRDASAELPAKAPTGQTPGRSMNAKAVDIDGDGDIDLIIAMEFAPNRVLINTGKGIFTDESSRLPQNARDSEEIVLVDVDQDKDLDIVVANEDDLRQELYINDGKGRFSDESRRLNIRVKANAVAVLDANRDGISDLFFGGDKVSHLLMGQKGGQFADESATRLPDTYGATQAVGVGDINGDGVTDLVLGNEDRNQLYLGHAHGAFRLGTLPLKEPVETRDVVLFDANGDGLLDVYFANVRLWNPRAVLKDTLLLNTPSGLSDASAAWLPVREESTLSALAFDYDLDGKRDLLLTTLGRTIAGPDFDGKVLLMRNTGSSFEDVSAQTLPTLPGTVGFDAVNADFNGDGKTDIFVAGRIGPDLLLLSQ